MSPFSVVPKSTLIAMAVLAALLIWETAAPFFPFFQRKLGERTRHGIRNALLGLLNAILISTLFLAAWAQIAHWTQTRHFGLLHWIGLHGWFRWCSAFLLLDLAFYLWHRANHHFPFFWRFHRTHHSDRHVDVTTATRFHLGEVFFESILKGGLIAALGLRLEELSAYHALVFAISQFHHANIGLGERFDRVLRLAISSPAMHKVHHSIWQPETDSNYSAIFSIWDRLFGTYRLADSSRLVFGLDEKEEQEQLASLLRDPWRANENAARNQPAGRPIQNSARKSPA